MNYTSRDKREAIERELRYRRRVYERRVNEGAMTRDFAEEQIAIFQAILADYQKAEEGERLL